MFHLTFIYTGFKSYCLEKIRVHAGKIPPGECVEKEKTGDLRQNSGEQTLLKAWVWRWCSQRRMRRGLRKVGENRRIKWFRSQEQLDIKTKNPWTTFTKTMSIIPMRVIPMNPNIKADGEKPSIAVTPRRYQCPHRGKAEKIMGHQKDPKTRSCKIINRYSLEM